MAVDDVIKQIYVENSYIYGLSESGRVYKRYNTYGEWELICKSPSIAQKYSKELTTKFEDSKKKSTPTRTRYIKEYIKSKLMRLHITRTDTSDLINLK